MEEVKITDYDAVSKRIRQVKPMLSLLSVKNYVQTLKMMNRLTGYTTIEEYINKPKTTIAIIDKQSNSLHTRKNRCCGVVNVIVALAPDKTSKKYENALKVYRAYMFTMKINIDKQAEERNGEMTEREKKNFISYEQLQATFNFYNKLVKKAGLLKKSKKTLLPADYQLLRMYLTLSLFSFLPPARNEYVELIGIGKKQYNKLSDEEKKDNNYLIYETIRAKELIINKYKTAKINGTRSYKITSKGILFNEGKKTYTRKGRQLNSILNLWNKYLPFNEPKGYYMFHNIKGRPMTKNNFTKFLNQIFRPVFPDKKVSSNILRKAFHSTKEKQEFKKYYNETLKDTQSMGHTLNTAMKSYSKKAS